jgi:hypothetical protein
MALILDRLLPLNIHSMLGIRKCTADCGSAECGVRSAECGVRSAGGECVEFAVTRECASQKKNPFRVFKKCLQKKKTLYQ